MLKIVAVDTSWTHADRTRRVKGLSSISVSSISSLIAR
jgi:hypothetical protein